MTTTETVLAVKPLVWEGDKAQSPIGVYSVTRTPDGYASSFEWEEIAHTGYNAVDASYGARRAAQDHCQADYEQRILSALALREVEPVAKDNRCDYCKEHGFQHPNLCEDCRHAVHDIALAINLRKLATAKRDCPVCDGDGVKANGNQCFGCGGTGKVPTWWGVDKTLAAAAEAIERLAATSAPNPAPSGEAAPVASPLEELAARQTDTDPDIAEIINRNRSALYMYAAPPQGVVHDALLAARDLAKTMEGLTGCRSAGYYQITPAGRAALTEQKP